MSSRSPDRLSILVGAWVLLALLGACSSAGGAMSGNAAQSGAAGAAALGGAAASTPLLADPSVDSGRLPSGLSFSLKENANPRDRLLLRLIVRAGSLDEKDDELGAAHFIEHLAFKGTKSFPEDSIVRYLESLGMTVGADVNARTGYEYTEYRLQVPSHDQAALRSAFAMLRDWADGISFDEAAVNDERRVILAEERRSRGLSERLWKAQLPAVYGDSRYARSTPIGTPESIEALDAAKLRAFYERWYRPDRMCVVAVGDLSTAEQEQLLRSAFAGLEARPGPESASRSVPQWSGTRVSVVRDAELGYGSLVLGVRLPFTPVRTVGAFEAGALRSLALALLQNRFREVLRRSGGRTLREVAFDERDLGGDYLLLTATVSFDGDWRDAARSLLGELTRVVRHGYSAQELTVVEHEILSTLAEWKENGLSSSEWSARLGDSFTRGSVPVAANDRIAYYRALFAQVSRAQLAEAARAFGQSQERVALLSLPEEAAPAPAAVLAELARAAPDPGPWTAGPRRAAIMDRAPDPVPPLRQESVPALGMTDLQYANGLRVLMKPMRARQDEIALYAVALRGSDELSLEGYANASLAPSLIPAGGFPGLPADALRLALSDTRVSLAAGIDETECHLRGTSDEAGLELLLQLVHRTMTDPQVDPGYFAALKKNTMDYGRDFTNAPGKLLQRTIMQELYPDDPRKLLFSRAEDADYLHADAMRDSFERLFGAASGFSFCFTGSFDPEKLRDLCDRYLGSLPAGAPPTTALQSEAIRSGGDSKTIRVDNADKATVVMVYATSGSATDARTVDGLAVLAEALKRELRERLRLGAGGSYDPVASARTNIDGRYSIVDISFDAAPKRADELVRLTRDIVGGIRDSGLPQADIDRVVLAFKQQLQTASDNDSYMARRIAWSAARGLDLDPVASTLASLSSMTTEWTKAAARRYLDPGNLVVFTMLPKRN